MGVIDISYLDLVTHINNPTEEKNELISKSKIQVFSLISTSPNVT